VISSFLAWNFGEGYQVRKRFDAIMGCNHEIFILGSLVQYLRVYEKLTLNMVNKLEETTLWNKGWL
jgi:hypothetical protein